MSMDLQNPHSPGGMSATLKQEGRDRPWIVFHGTPQNIEANLKATFPELADNDGPLWDLINEAQRMFTAVGNVHKTLGGRPANSKSGSAWAEARGEAGSSAPAEEQKPEPTLADLIEACETVDELKELWLDHSKEIQANNLVDAWKARGAALKAAA